MNRLKNFYRCLSFICLFTCQSSKSTSDKLYNNTWELEFISGPRIAFNGLFPDKKPYIVFNKNTHQVEGNASCNGYSAKYSLDDEHISFSEPGPTTMMYCGEGEKVFLNTIKKINTFRFDDKGKLNLLMDDVPMMRFKKAN